jgi:hypothetical protein
LRSEIRKGGLGLQTISAGHNIKETVRRIKEKQARRWGPGSTKRWPFYKLSRDDVSKKQQGIVNPKNNFSSIKKQAMNEGIDR